MKKISRREFLAASAAVSAAGVLAACGGSSSSAPAANTPAGNDAPAAAPVTLIWNEVNPETSIAGRVGLFMSQKAEELSGGSIKIDVRAGGSLYGTEADVIDDMSSPAPTVDCARMAIQTMDNYSVPSTRVTNVPYVFQGDEHFWKFAASDIGTQILTDPDTVGGLGFVGKAYFAEGFRSFFFAKEVTDMAGMAGLNIRVSNSNLYVGLVKALGANPVDVAFAELYQSLGGVCDGGEQPIANYEANSFYEPAPYMLLDEHVLGSGMLVITNIAWDKLSDDQKAAMEQAFKATEDYNKEILADAIAASRKVCEDAGVVFTEVPDKQPWIDACASVIAENTAGVEDVYNAIVALA